MQSLQTSQRFSSTDEQAKLHKAMSQGEITKLAVRQKASDSDLRYKEHTEYVTVEC